MIKNRLSSRIKIDLKENDSQAEIVRKLAEDCLKFKWIKEQKKNLNKVLTPCAFCIYYRNENEPCLSCTIDKHICDENGTQGIMGKILSKYGNALLKDLDEFDYEKMRTALKELKSKNYHIRA